MPLVVLQHVLGGIIAGENGCGDACDGAESGCDSAGERERDAEEEKHTSGSIRVLDSDRET